MTASSYTFFPLSFIQRRQSWVNSAASVFQEVAFLASSFEKSALIFGIISFRMSYPLMKPIRFFALALVLSFGWAYAGHTVKLSAPVPGRPMMLNWALDPALPVDAAPIQWVRRAQPPGHDVTQFVFNALIDWLDLEPEDADRNAQQMTRLVLDAIDRVDLGRPFGAQQYTVLHLIAGVDNADFVEAILKRILDLERTDPNRPRFFDYIKQEDAMNRTTMELTFLDRRREITLLFARAYIASRHSQYELFGLPEDPTRLIFTALEQWLRMEPLVAEQNVDQMRNLVMGTLGSIDWGRPFADRGNNTVMHLIATTDDPRLAAAVFQHLLALERVSSSRVKLSTYLDQPNRLGKTPLSQARSSTDPVFRANFEGAYLASFKNLASSLSLPALMEWLPL